MKLEQRVLQLEQKALEMQGLLGDYREMVINQDEDLLLTPETEEDKKPLEAVTTF